MTFAQASMLLEASLGAATVMVVLLLLALAVAYGFRRTCRAIAARLHAAGQWWRLLGRHRFIGVAPAPAGSLSSPEAEAAREADLIAALQPAFAHIDDAYVRHLSECYLIPGEDL